MIPLRQTRLGLPKDPLKGLYFLFQGRKGKFNDLVDSVLGATSLAGDNAVAVRNRVEQRSQFGECTRDCRIMRFVPAVFARSE